MTCVSCMSEMRVTIYQKMTQVKVNNKSWVNQKKIIVIKNNCFCFLFFSCNFIIFFGCSFVRAYNYAHIVDTTFFSFSFHPFSFDILCDCVGVCFIFKIHQASNIYEIQLLSQCSEFQFKVKVFSFIVVQYWLYIITPSAIYYYTIWLGIWLCYCRSDWSICLISLLFVVRTQLYEGPTCFE